MLHLCARWQIMVGQGIVGRRALDGDSSRSQIVLVHGTWGQGFDPYKFHDGRSARWFEPGHPFYVQLLTSLEGHIAASDVSAFMWSGANSIRERSEAATELASVLDRRLQEAPGVEQILIAHSHGGNVALRARDAMTGDRSRVHIITLATPFIRVTRRAITFADRLLARGLLLAAVIAGIAVYVGAWLLLAAIDNALSFFALSMIGPVSLCWACVTLARKARQSDTSDDAVPRGPMPPLARANIFALVMNGIVLVLAGVLSGGAGVLDANANVVPFICSQILLVSWTKRSLFDLSSLDDPKFRTVGQLTILRSRRDEASLALLAGKITSSLSYAIGILSIVTPLVMITLASPLLFIAGNKMFKGYQDNEMCRNTGARCGYDLAGILKFVEATANVWQSIVKFALAGLAFCLILIVLMAVSKATFGRELLWRSTNLNVDVHDAPDGTAAVPVQWCEPARHQMFGLRHSLYESPDAVAKIIEAVRMVRRQSVDVPLVDQKSGPTEPTAKARTPIVIGLVSILLYVSVIAYAYAPAGAPSLACRVRSLSEARNPDNKLTALIAGIDGDDGRGTQWLARELKDRAGLNVVETCWTVLPDGENKAALMASRNADFLIWGRRTGSKLTLALDARREPSDNHSPPVAPVAGFEEPFWRELRSALIKEIEDTGFSSRTFSHPALVSQYADQISAIVSKIKPDESSFSDPISDLHRITHWIELEGAAGMLAYAAAVNNKNAEQAKRSVEHFTKAIAMRNAHNQYGILSEPLWLPAYYDALVLDAEMSRNRRSAEIASQYYIQQYGHWRHEAVPLSTLYKASDQAAHAAATEFLITNDRKTAQLRDHLACETLIWLRQARATVPLMRERFLRERAHDKWLGEVEEPPAAATFFAYRILKDRPGLIDRISSEKLDEPIESCMLL